MRWSWPSFAVGAASAGAVVLVAMTTCSWEAAARLRGGAEDRRTVLVDADGTLVFATGRVVAVLGIRNAVVVETPDAVLVVARDRAEEVKRVVAALERRGGLGVL